MYRWSLIVVCIILPSHLITGQSLQDTSIITIIDDEFFNAYQEKRVIGIGEYSHGSLMSQKAKIALIQYFINHSDIRLILLEADITSVKTINDFILGSSASIEIVMSSLWYWWNNDDVKTFLFWLRNYNALNEDKVRVKGIDFQIPWNSLKELETSMSKNPGAALLFERIKNGFITLESNGSDKKLIRQIDHEIDKLFENTDLKHTVSDRNNLLKLKAILKLKRLDRSKGYKMREKLMFDNLMSSADQPLILWAHNDHVAKNKVNSLGKRIDRQFGDEYMAIGTTAYQGYFTAFSQDSLGKYGLSVRNELTIPSETTIEFYLKRNFKENTLLRVKPFLDKVELPLKKYGFRSIGAYAPTNPDYQFLPNFSLEKNFDFLIFFPVDKAAKR